ncbi:MAG TPA: PhzF family phenazine biosynthesis protein [Candidatus Sulfotelmatobacter sp.]|nr:PhzF family phenazine biosynthesis protein [Candidatus Sulfotelmatobacter sp.]
MSTRASDTLPVYFVDAFADRPYAGNPAAICPLDRWLPEPAMQAIAAEIGFSETAFIVREGEDWRIRWFTPTLEVDLVGHATLAAAFVILERIDPRRAEIRFESRGGPLIVGRAGDLLSMDFPARVAAPVVAPLRLVEGLGKPPVAVLAATHYLAVYADAADVRGLAPDMATLAALDRAAVIVTAPGTPELGADFVSRFFAPANGVPEDPVSGVAHCTLIPYWASRLGKTRLIGRQLSKRGGELVCEDRGARVLIAGRAALVLEGRIVRP